MESEKFFENRGKSETGGKCIIDSGGMDTPELIPGMTLRWDRILRDSHAQSTPLYSVPEHFSPYPFSQIPRCIA